MGKIGCNIDGNLDDSKFSVPIPWIGIYVAAASVACLIAMATDAVNAIRHRKFWFPSKVFSLNATSLTLIAIAVKLSVDLNTPMPLRREQLAKLSSSVLMCTMIGNSLPSLGTMQNKEIFMNVVALGILVITSIVNICIQLGTGVIYVFWVEHASVMFLMLVLLVLMSSSALTVPATKSYLELKYNKRYELALKEESHEIGETGRRQTSRGSYEILDDGLYQLSPVCDG
ncbi:putative Plant/MNJ7-17 protein [Quillaja saponaria]|uniref:Plant/MNJ7-17 protein n=1 Tax=Quillaja saponaria TaxID=32244 RepID=A0AAD7L6J1_QUISA|nr:putative Plant/MNJ7-17 protein [Quillaja saponaria]